MFSKSQMYMDEIPSSLDNADADTVVRQLFVVARSATTVESRELSARLTERFLGVHNLTPPRLAQEIGVAPQTVNRWLTAKFTPRPAQIIKLQSLTQRTSTAINASATNGDNDFTSFLGVRPLEYVMNLESEANAIWIASNGYLRESNRGPMGEQILQALRQGVHFRYVFHARSEAAGAFSQMLAWLKNESFTGKVTGYVIKSDEMAYRLGLSSAPGAWISIEYSPLQATRLQRNFDVFHALSAREYADAEKCRIKNDDGQSCWVELPTAQAQLWHERLRQMAKKTATNPDIDVCQIESQPRHATRNQTPCDGNCVSPKAIAGAG